MLMCNQDALPQVATCVLQSLEVHLTKVSAMGRWPSTFNLCAKVSHPLVRSEHHLANYARHPHVGPKRLKSTLAIPVELGKCWHPIDPGSKGYSK